MDYWQSYLGTHWPAVALVGVAVVVAVASKLRRSRVGFVLAAGLSLLALGGLAVTPSWSLWLVIGAATLFAVMFAVLIVTGAWWPPLAWAGVVVVGIGLGGLALDPAGRLIGEAARALTTLEFGTVQLRDTPCTLFPSP